MQIVVLCGGKGTRLKKLNGNIPKLLTKFNDKTFLEILVDFLKKFNVDEILLLTGYGHEQIQKEIVKFMTIFNIEAIKDDELGGGGFKSLIDASNKKKLRDNFILIFGDSLPQFNLQEPYKIFEDSNIPVMMSYIKAHLVKEKPRIKLEGDKILYTAEKNPSKEFNLVDYGVTYFKSSVLEEYLDKNIEDLKLFMELVTKNRIASGWEIAKPYIEFGNLESYKIAYPQLSQFKKWKI